MREPIKTDPDEWIHPHERKVADTGVKFIGGGLTKREWFAGLALQGILANSHFSERGEKRYDAGEESDGVATQIAIDVADEIIEELSK